MSLIITNDKTLCELCGESKDMELVVLSEFNRYRIDWRRDDPGWKSNHDQHYIKLCFDCQHALYRRLDPYRETRTRNLVRIRIRI